MKKNNRYFSRLGRAMQMELQEHKSSFIIYMILRLLVIVVLITQFFKGNYEHVFLCVLTLLLLLVPSFIQLTFKIELPTTLEIIILLFIFAAEILGEINNFYYQFAHWDTILHTANGFLAAGIGFSLVDLLNQNEKIKFMLSPLFTAIVAFCFSMTIGVIWEFFEYSMDTFFAMNTQKDTMVDSLRYIPIEPNGKYIRIPEVQSVIINGYEVKGGQYVDIGLIDTMEDLQVNMIGAIAFSVFGYYYTKRKGEGGFAKRFIPVRKKKEQDYLAIIEDNVRNRKEMEEG